MSLFGESPPRESDLKSRGSQRMSKSLFNDDTPAEESTNGSLFADRGNANGDSPWGMPTPKKAARGDMIKRLILDQDAPSSYVDAFDLILKQNGQTGGPIPQTEVLKLIGGSNISSTEQKRIQSVLAPATTRDGGVERGAFNVLLALIGLAQDGEEVTLDGVDEKRKNLPVPMISYIEDLKAAQGADTDDAQESEVKDENRGDSQPQRPRQIRHDSLDHPEADPWASPAALKQRPIQSSTAVGGSPNRSSLSHNVPARTTSAFTTQSEDTEGGGSKGAGSMTGSGQSGGTAWGALENPGGGFQSSGSSSGLGSGGFGSGGDEGSNPGGRPSRPLAGGGRASTGGGVEETVTVTTLPEKEGTFLFQHRNYEVKSARRGSIVVRRYSDFVWLLDCLHKRYPFRQLPLLPPKRVAVNGRHLSSDTGFIEKRRRGLTRFANALVRHPVLNQEQLVVMFLTVPTELSVWRKQASISLQEEFIGKPLPPGLEDSLPTNLLDTFDTVRFGVRKSADTYIGLCNLMERLAKRNQGMAGDSIRFSQSLRSLVEDSENTYAVDNNDVPLLNEGIQSAARHLETSHSLLEDEARAWDEGILEDLKKHRDCLVSVREMFDRRDRYAKNNIPQLERRIEANENKLANLRAKPEGTVKPGEQDKVAQAILSDKQSIVNQHARGVFIKECIRDELVYFQRSQYQVSRLHQDWSQERVKYSELQAENWRALSDEVDNMPLGD